MAKGLLLSFSDDEVEEIRQNCISALKSGQVTTSFTSEGTSATMTQVLPISTLLEEVNYYNKIKHPEIYGNVVRRTKPSFYTN